MLGFALFVGASEVRKTGSTLAGDALYRATAHDLMVRARLHNHCNKVDAIHTETLKEASSGGVDATRQVLRYGSVEERWTVSLCQRQLPYRVTFTADAGGGIYASIGAE
jgi:hypothetical protein